MPVSWNNATKRGGKLQVYFDPGLAKTVWGGVLDGCRRSSICSLATIGWA